MENSAGLSDKQIERTDNRMFLETGLACAQRSGMIATIERYRAGKNGRNRGGHKSHESGIEMHRREE